MSTKYLGERFDIHGGGMDLVFPHHESEIAQSVAANKTEPVKYWIHNNMITIKGQKMGKSLNNFITLNDLFSGNNKVLSQAFSPMTIRFFILQAHYRSTLDFSNEALIAAEKGLKKLLNVFNVFDKLKTSGKSSFDVKEIQDKCYQAMNDDFNSPIVIAHLFDAVRMINSVKDNKETISAPDLELLKKIFNVFVFEILGLKSEKDNDQTELIDGLMQMILSVRQNAKNNKDYATSDKIRDELLKLNIKVKDTKDGAEWQFE